MKPFLSITDFERQLHDVATAFAREWRLNNVRDDANYPLSMSTEDWLDQWETWMNLKADESPHLRRST
jgi:hypothetical protein